MTVAEIIRQVRWCIDHESSGDAGIADAGEDAYMDNIIRAKISDAMLWVTRMAADNATLGTVTSVFASDDNGALSVQPYGDEGDIGIISVPANVVAAGISRVRIAGWHKAATPIPDTADDAVMMFDESARATADRPMAVVMGGNPVRVLVQPYTEGAGSVEVTYVGTPGSVDVSDDNAEVTVPPAARNAFLYYIAYLLLTAYGDARAQAMLAVAVQSVGNNSAN